MEETAIIIHVKATLNVIIDIRQMATMKLNERVSGYANTD